MEPRAAMSCGTDSARKLAAWRATTWRAKDSALPSLEGLTSSGKRSRSSSSSSSLLLLNPPPVSQPFNSSAGGGSQPRPASGGSTVRREPLLHHRRIGGCERCVYLALHPSKSEGRGTAAPTSEAHPIRCKATWSVRPVYRASDIDGRE